MRTYVRVVSTQVDTGITMVVKKKFFLLFRVKVRPDQTQVRDYSAKVQC